MPTEITVDAAGRLVLPETVSARHHLAPGTRLTLVEEPDRLVLVTVRPIKVPRRAELLLIRGRLTGEVPDHRALRDERLNRLAGLS